MAVLLTEPASGPSGPPAPLPPAAAGGRGAPPTVERRIELPPYDLATALALERELGISHVLAQVLVRRGLRTPAEVRELLDATECHDPLAFDGIDAVLATIGAHVHRGSRIVVHGDYDVDGVCATAVLVRALRRLGAEPGWFIPSRSDDGYGLSQATVERLAARPGPPTLLITVDCGITAVEEVAAAQAAGVEVVITDHHSPRADGRLPDCPIVHPVLGHHPFASLCGTAVAHKLAQGLGGATAEDDLELVALATVADLMPLVGENRRLVREGLVRLAGTDRPGLRALMDVSGTDPSALDAAALGFRLAPRINAAGRLRRADAALELLLTEDPERAREIAAELNALNLERRAVEQRIGWEAEAQVAELGERSAYVLAAPGWHAGVIGIVASRIVERLHRPAILVALDRADSVSPASPAPGSGRSIPGFDLLGALHATAEHLDRYGGHRAAAGLSLRPDRLDAFRTAIERHAESVLTPEMLRATERIDAVASGPELTLGLAEELLRLEPCGMGNPAVNLLLTGARFESVRAMGEGGRHARFAVVSGGARASAVAFGCDGRVPGGDGEAVEASFRLDRNVWRGVTEARLTLRHAVRCDPGPIEVLGEPADYIAAALCELERPLAPTAPSGDRALRTVLDRRRESPLAVLADAGASGPSVLAVCADVSRRLSGLSARAGGFALVSYAGLADDPGLASRFGQLVVLDPPSDAFSDEIIRRGGGFTHLAWGEAELRFAEQMHEMEYGLRTSLVTFYRSLRLRERVAGEELGHLLRGDGPQPRSPRLAGRLVRVLAELELVSLDRDLPALAIAGAQPTQLDRSAAFRVYRQRYEDGQRFLNRARPRRRP